MVSDVLQNVHVIPIAPAAFAFLIELGCADQSTRLQVVVMVVVTIVKPVPVTVVMVLVIVPRVLRACVLACVLGT